MTPWEFLQVLAAVLLLLHVVPELLIHFLFRNRKP